MKIPTVKVKFPHESGDYMVINEDRFDPAVHELYEPGEPTSANHDVEIRPRGGGWFDVVKDGEVINEKGLREADAEKLAAEVG